MILNNATDASAEWTISNSEGDVKGIKSPMSWGTVTPPPGPFDYTVTFTGPSGSATADNIDNPDALVTFLGTQLVVTYPGA